MDGTQRDTGGSLHDMTNRYGRIVMIRV